MSGAGSGFKIEAIVCGWCISLCNRDDYTRFTFRHIIRAMELLCSWTHRWQWCCQLSAGRQPEWLGTGQTPQAGTTQQAGTRTPLQRSADPKKQDKWNGTWSENNLTGSIEETGKMKSELKKNNNHWIWFNSWDKKYILTTQELCVGTCIRALSTFSLIWPWEMFTSHLRKSVSARTKLCFLLLYVFTKNTWVTMLCTDFTLYTEDRTKTWLFHAVV